MPRKYLKKATTILTHITLHMVEQGTDKKFGNAIKQSNSTEVLEEFWPLVLVFARNTNTISPHESGIVATPLCRSINTPKSQTNKTMGKVCKCSGTVLVPPPFEVPLFIVDLASRRSWREN